MSGSLQNLAQAADEDDEAEADVELELPPMFPLSLELMCIGIGAGIDHSVECCATLLVTEGSQEKTDEKQSCEEYCHRKFNNASSRRFLKRWKKELVYVEWVGLSFSV